MSIGPEELAAFADGELSGDQEKRVAAAVAADPQLEAKVEAHRQLQARLAGAPRSVPERSIYQANTQLCSMRAPPARDMRLLACFVCPALVSKRAPTDAAPQRVWP